VGADRADPTDARGAPTGTADTARTGRAEAPRTGRAEAAPTGKAEAARTGTAGVGGIGTGIATILPPVVRVPSGSPGAVGEDVRVDTALPRSERQLVELAITLIGPDRPGVIADVAEILAGLGLNLTDSTMTRLRGHFAMTLVCAGRRDEAEVAAAVRSWADGSGLSLTVRAVGPESDEPVSGQHFVLSLHGADRLGIVAAFARLLADVEGNITDLTTRLSGDLYVLVAEVDLPSVTDLPALETRIRRTAGGLGVDAVLRRVEADVL
jgi:glycine cleavage system transcriptional repressor